MTDENLQDWCGQPLGSVVTLCLYHPGAFADGPIRPRLVCVPQGSHVVPIVIQTQQLAQFLETHADSVLVCHDAGALPWRLHEYFRKVGSQDAIATSWNFSRHGRLHDVILFDQRVRMVLENRYTLPKHLHQLVRIPVEFQEGMVLDSHHAGQLVDALSNLYRVLRRRTLGLVPDSRTPKSRTFAFGPLGLGFDVQATIAMAPVQTRGLRVHRELVEQLRQRAEGLYQRASERLSADHQARHCFRWDDSRVKRDRQGKPKIHNERLRDWLETIWGTLRDVHNAQWTLPHDDRGRLSLVPADWGVLVRCDHRLRAWAELVAMAKIMRELTENATGILRPRYAVIPELRAFPISLPMHHRIGPLFQPRSHHRFHCIKLNDLELRCYARLCEQRHHPPDVYLARLIRDGRDPVVVSAAELFRRRTGGHGAPTLEQFLELREMEPSRFHHWVILTKVLLFSIPRGLANGQVRDLLLTELPTVNYGEAEISRFRRILEDLHNELEYFLEDPTLETLASRLGRSQPEVFRRLRLDETPCFGSAENGILADWC